MKKIINTSDVPLSVYPYSQVIFFGGLLYILGQIAIDSSHAHNTRRIKKEASQAMKNIKSILKRAGMSLKTPCESSYFLKGRIGKR